MRLRVGGRPDKFADVETKGPANAAHSADVVSLAGSVAEAGADSEPPQADPIAEAATPFADEPQVKADDSEADDGAQRLVEWIRSLSDGGGDGGEESSTERTRGLMDRLKGRS